MVGGDDETTSNALVGVVSGIVSSTLSFGYISTLTSITIKLPNDYFLLYKQRVHWSNDWWRTHGVL